MNIIAKPEIGEVAYAICRPFFNGSVPYVRHVLGVIEDIKDNEFRIRDVDEWIPIHRVRTFTFGGIMIANNAYDEDRCTREDNELLDLLEEIEKNK